MKLHLFQELMGLNQAFEQVLRGLMRMENERFFQKEIIRYARAEVEAARVDANREFFDAFEDIVEKHAGWAYRFQREYDRKATDVEDLYLEIREREAIRKKKGLPPRLTFLPNWVPHDEESHDEKRRRRKHARKPGTQRIYQPQNTPANGSNLPKTGLPTVAGLEGKT